MKTGKEKLVILSAPSGAGKTTLCKRLQAEFPELALSISFTTRNPRGSERDGVEYFFVNRAEFERMIAQEKFAEWALVHGNYYGTALATIDGFLARGRFPLLDIDVQGAESLRRNYPGRCLSLFVAPPSLEVLEQRLRARATDTPEVIERRMQAARIEMKDAPRFDHVIVNDDLERAYQEARALVASAIAR